jgi:hypothetical protein
MDSASGRVARFQANSRVWRMLRRLSFAPMLEKPTMGGV